MIEFRVHFFSSRKVISGKFHWTYFLKIYLKSDLGEINSSSKKLHKSIFFNNLIKNSFEIYLFYIYLFLSILKLN